jgi:DNA-binding beta-propeller fold protein YncE
MRAIVFAVCLLFASVGIAQSSLKLVQLAEFAAGLAQPHDAAFAPDRTLIYLTDIANSRMVVLEAMTLHAAADGSIYVVDSGNHRVQVLDADAKHRASFGSVLKLNEPKYLHFVIDQGKA